MYEHVHWIILMHIKSQTFARLLNLFLWYSAYRTTLNASPET